MDDKQQNWFVKHKVLTAVIAVGILIFIISIAAAGNNTSQNDSSDSENTASDNAETATDNDNGSNEEAPETEEQPAERQVQGEAATLGTGMFTGGTHVEVGLYDVTTVAGQSGNFFVNDGAKVNEILGSDLGVDKVRVRISADDNIEISGLSDVIFTPVDSAFVTDYKAVSLHAGTFIVGEDVATGRYTIAPGAGQSGNLFVNDGLKVNEILGSDFGVPEITVNLSDGDKITISGLSEVTFTPSN